MRWDLTLGFAVPSTSHMEKEAGANMFLKVGDEVIIVKHKFPELHPKNTLKKVVKKTPEELRAIHNKCKKQGDSDMSFSKSISFDYELKGINCIGMIGEIVEIDPIARTEREVETGEIAKYVVKFITNLASWKNKRMTFYPEEVQKIGKIYQEVETDKEKKEKDNKEIDPIIQKKLF